MRTPIIRASVVLERKKRGRVRMDHNTSDLKSMESSNKKIKTPCLISYKELPDYMRDNEFILKYYRANWSIKQAFFSIFRWHNETLNIWTHLVGFVLFLFLVVVNLVDVPHQIGDFMRKISWSYPLRTWSQNDSSDRLIMGVTSNIMHDLNKETMYGQQPQPNVVQWPFYVFLTGSIICLILSTISHLFSCHSHSLNLTLLKLDYLGITTMIITFYFPPMYYIFQCSPHFQVFYLTTISVFGILTIITLFSPDRSASPKYRVFRTMVFVSMGLFGVVPAVHAVVENWHEPGANVTLAYEGCMALSYLVGAVVYIARVPERFRPGLFDLVGHSHQIFHVLVICGALAHYAAALIFLEYRRRVGCSR